MTKIVHFKKIISVILFFLALIFFGGAPKKTSADAVPLAARLLAEPYETTGVQVTMTNMSNMYGLTNDGTYAYAIKSDGNVVSTPLAAIAALPGGSATTTVGTVHSVGWGVGGAPAWPGSSQLSLAYSHGCIFITNNSNTEGQIHLYCIDVSDYSVTDIAVPANKPLPAGYYYVISSLIDFSDGRVGKVSAETEVNGQYESTLRTYTLTGTGKNVSLAWSQDFVMADPNLFATDEHGIATDGTYLYRIQWRDYNPNTKVWALSNTGAASIVYSGQYTMPFDNMHFLSHNHTNNYYLVGHFNNNHFFITKAADPGPGPGNALTPTFSTATSTSGGYTVQVTNYDSSFTWSVSSTAGSAQISNSGVITVSGLSESATATTTATTTKSGYPSGSASVAGTSLADATAPTISSSTATTTSTSATLTWSTNESASSRVSFGLTTSYSSSTTLADTSPRVTTHSVSLASLPSCTTYHYVVVSADAAGNNATSTDATFTTTGCLANDTPLAATSTATTVSSGGSLSMVTDSATLTVTTPENVTASSSSLVIQIQKVAKDNILSLTGRPTSKPNEVGSIVFDVKAIINNTTVLESFDHPVTISYQYSESDVASISQSTLWLYHYHDSSWQALDDCTVNTSQRTITCTTPSFSVFALFGRTTSTSSSSSSSSTQAGSCINLAVEPTALSSGSTKSSLSFAIDNNQQTTASNVVNIAMNANPQTVRGYVISLDPNFSDVKSIIPYTANAKFTLPNKFGTYTIYLKYYSTSGIYSQPLSATITYKPASRDLAEIKKSATISIYPKASSTKKVAKTTIPKKSVEVEKSTICKYTKTLRLGSRGIEVKDLQAFLKTQDLSIYPEGTVNGVFGPATEQAVIRFQEKYTKDVLEPWGIAKGTGYVYKTTKAKMCALSKGK